MRTLLSLVVVLALGLAGSANAEILNVDLDGRDASQGDVTVPSAGITGPAGGGTTWNQVDVENITPNTPSMTSGFVDSNGGATTATLALSSFGGADTFVTYGTHGVYSDYSWWSTSSPTVTIGGMIAGSSYDVHIFGQNGVGNPSCYGAFSVNGSAVQIGSPSGTLFSLGNNYLLFSGILADGSGQLVITGHSPGTILNGFQIDGNLVVPEPSTLVLLGAGGLALIAIAISRRRKRSKV